MKNKKILFLSAFVLALFLALCHYYHWDDRLYQLWEEQQFTEAEKVEFTWFDGYIVDIEAKSLGLSIQAEASGLAWHPQRNTLFTIAERTPTLFELDLDGNVLNAIDLINGGDTEAVTVVSDGRIAVIDERRCIIFLFELPEESSIDVLDLSKVTHIDLLAKMPGLNLPSNKGVEGMAWDSVNSRFLIGKERDPAGLYSISYDLQTGEEGEELEEIEIDSMFVRDISGLTFDPETENILVLSHESNLLKVVDKQGTTPNFMSFTRFVNGLSKAIPQAEGITIDDRGTLYIVSEPNLFYRFNKK